jgi:phage repressor protein C with HTH and peptisase S24 domain
MEPVFSEFDRVLTYNWGAVQKGSVIVFRQKSDYFIKRIVKISGGLVYVSGDNKAKSSKIGPIKVNDIVGRAFLKY